jgi:uncharacterized protein YigE (DUF2233 family)
MKFYSLLLLLLLSKHVIATQATSSQWQPLKEGIDYKTIERIYHDKKNQPRHSKLHAFRLQQGKFSITAHSFHQLVDEQRVSVDDFRQQQNALMVLSGGFFQTNFREPVGLMIEKGQQLFPLTNSLSGVVWIKADKLHLSTTQDFKKRPLQPDYALQGYPRIVDPINQQGINTKRQNYRHRAALCQIKGYFIILINDKNFAGLSLYELARIAQAKETQHGLHCDIAINLDGGPAPALSVDPAIIAINEKEQAGWQVPNVIVIKNNRFKSPK